jgi:hypothetical protein
MIKIRYKFKDDFGEAPKRPPLEKRSLLQFILEEGNVFSPNPPSIEKGEGCLYLKLGGLRFKASLISLKIWGGIISPQQKLIRTTPRELKSLGVDWEELEKLLLPPTNSPQIPSKKTIKISLDFIASEEEAEEILSFIRERGKVLFLKERS